MDLSAIKQTFLAEVEEVLQNMEDFILTLESYPDDKDNINALFRAAHTIKGSAGIIGLEDVERFTHKVENVLDRLRSEKIDVSCDLIGLMLKSKDHIKKLVDYSFSDTLSNEVKDKIRDAGDDISSCLTVYMFQAPGATDSSATGSSNSDSSAGASLDKDAGVLPHGSGTWHISLRFGKSVIRDGMDPISMINYLSKLGRIINLATIAEALPRAEEMDPEDCYLGFEIDLNSSCDKQTIEDVFEFVMDDSEIKVIPPHSSIDVYVSMIRSLPEDSWMLGDILVKGGVVTRRDIDIALKKQVSEAEGSGEKPYIGDILVNEGIVRREIVDAALDKQQQVREGLGSGNGNGTSGQPISGTTSTIRVDSEKLDLLLNFVGELVVATGGIKQRALSSKDVELLKSSTFLTKLVDDVRDMSMRMRMIPIGTVFSRFQRMVRDLSKELGKEIDIIITGGETELDKAMVEKINDPLTHLVRNAVDHGIEQPHERLSKGKPARAKVLLNAYYGAGIIVIEITDDGRGLNRELIMKKAISLGFVSPDKTLSDRELLNVIFEPGFSTATEVTKLSGRGVGMDVVKRNIEALRGFASVESEEGKGTTVKIQLPLTLSIIDGFMVGVDNARYIIPLDLVIKCFSVSTEEYREISNRRYFAFQEKVIPFVCLWDIFGLSGFNDYCENIVIVQYAGQQLAMAVDKLYGEIQAVIKSLGNVYRDLKGVSGATIIGDGSVVLILDVPGILKVMEENTL